MLSIFPEILFLSPFAATLIRTAVSLLFAYSAWEHFKRPDIASRALACFEILAAGLLFGGAWTQPAALLGMMIIAIWYFQPTSRVFALSTIALAFVMSISLVLTGPGAFAFDWPL